MDEPTYVLTDPWIGEWDHPAEDFLGKPEPLSEFFRESLSIELDRFDAPKNRDDFFRMIARAIQVFRVATGPLKGTSAAKEVMLLEQAADSGVRFLRDLEKLGWGPRSPRFDPFLRTGKASVEVTRVVQELRNEVERRRRQVRRGRPNSQEKKFLAERVALLLYDLGVSVTTSDSGAYAQILSLVFLEADGRDLDGDVSVSDYLRLAKSTRKIDQKN